MKYSKRITEFGRMYQLDPDDVFFALLLVCGCGDAESFATIYRPLTNNISTLSQNARSLKEKKPGVMQLVKSFGNIGISPFVSKLPITEEQKGRKPKKATPKSGSFRDKESVLSELEKLLQEVDDPKLRADLLFKISDLQQLKKETVVEEEKVHYYLPLTCCKCGLYQAYKAKETPPTNKG